MKDFFNIKNESNPILGILLILYILVPINVPKELSSPINSIYGRIVVLLLALASFTKTNAVNGILCLIAAYTLVKRTEKQNGFLENFVAEKFTPLKKESSNKLENLPVSLEEEVINNMPPLTNASSSSNPKYKPVLDAVYAAAPASNTYVIDESQALSGALKSESSTPGML